jgi:hypothetical protein
MMPSLSRELLQWIAGEHVAISSMLSPMLVRQSVQIKMSISAIIANFHKQLP